MDRLHMVICQELSVIFQHVSVRKNVEKNQDFASSTYCHYQYEIQIRVDVDKLRFFKFHFYYNFL